MKFVLVLVLVALFWNHLNAFKVLYPPQFAGKTYNSPWIANFYDNISTDTPFIGRLAGTWTENAGTFENAIVLACLVDSGSMEYQIRYLQPQGAIGFINCARFSRFPGIISHLRDGTDRSDLHIPVWDVAYLDIIELMEYMESENEYKNNTVILEMSWDGYNAWEAVYETPAYILYSVIIGGYALAIVILAIYKQTMYVRAFGFQRSIPQVCLWVEIFGNLERLVYHGVDPLWSRRIFPLTAGHILLTLSLPVFVTTSLLITLYWKELISAKQSRTIVFLNRMKVPFYVFVPLIWLIEIATSILRAIGAGPVALLTIVVTVLYAAVALFTAIFFLHYGVKLMKTLKSVKNRFSERKQSKYTAIRLLIGSAILELVYVLLLAFGATEYFYWPWGLFASNFISTLILISISLVQILAFSVPLLRPKTSGATPQASAKLEPSYSKTTLGSQTSLVSPRTEDSAFLTPRSNGSKPESDTVIQMERANTTANASDKSGGVSDSSSEAQSSESSQVNQSKSASKSPQQSEDTDSSSNSSDDEESENV